MGFALRKSVKIATQKCANVGREEPVIEETPVYICTEELLLLKLRLMMIIIYMTKQCRNVIDAEYHPYSGTIVSSVNVTFVHCAQKVKHMKTTEMVQTCLEDVILSTRI